ncbi:MAG: hypothetical protein FWF15_03835 [Oscillospiraceae bacterium]|nr:hypothetical protein [Oscillospiraceae bacterium]
MKCKSLHELNLEFQMEIDLSTDYWTIISFPMLVELYRSSQNLSRVEMNGLRRP